MKNVIFPLLIIAALFTSCGSIGTMQQAHQKLPESFDNNHFDTVSISQKTWKEFFTDPDLQALIDTALLRNTDLQMAIHQTQIAYTRLKMSRRAMLPSLQAQAGASYNYEAAQTPNALQHNAAAGGAETYGWGLSSSWEIDVWQRLAAARKADHARFWASQQAQRLVQTKLIAQLAYTWYELLAVDEDVRIIQRNIELQSAALELVRVQKEAGKATSLAVQQFEAQLLYSQSELVHLQQLQNDYEQLINNLCNRTKTPINRASSHLQHTSVPNDVAIGIPAQLLTNRPDIMEASLQLQAAGFDVKAAQRACYPQIVITPYLAVSTFESSLLFSPDALLYGLGANMLAPLFMQYKLRGTVKIKQIEQHQALLHYQSVITQAVNEVQYTQSNMQLHAQQYALAQQRSETLLSAIETSKDLYLYGFATYLEVINAQKSLLEAELLAVDLKKQQHLLYVDMYRALGGGK